MKKFSLVTLPVVAAASVFFLGGCSGSAGIQTETKPATPDPNKGSFNNVIKDNPNIPDSAKKAMMGGGGAAPAGK